MIEILRRFLLTQTRIGLILTACMFGAYAAVDESQWTSDRRYITEQTEQNKRDVRDLNGKIDALLAKLTEIEKQMAVMQEQVSYRAMFFGAGATVLTAVSSLVVIYVSSKLKGRGK